MNSWWASYYARRYERRGPRPDFSRGRPKFSAYEEKVLLLKIGDTVAFSGGKTFKLGRFLGAGNASHVFEVEGLPDAVLKIPFAANFLLISELASSRASSEAHTAISVARSFIGDLESKAPRLAAFPRENKIQLLELGRFGEYVLTSKVVYAQTASDFMDRHAEDKHLSAENQYKMNSLKALAGTVNRLLFQNFKLSECARQFVWGHFASEPEHTPPRWIMVDWE